ncbi:phage tail terminator-like protein [Rhizobium sp. CNPSo 3968]|uniref:phage tail terminator-like protein n=1 Tax=Rhizobium sp. CNPSo 3968 TaxID=3021408 RepID=UPI00254E161F|nr:phage tail terminator-like protein [Rhizobium sp. CNPSo 3968]MDK4720133.1 phage tail terminator-like protein [Rhizobium sp. CNPSo 3968]
MATTTDAIIFAALQAHLRTMPNVLPIAGPNVTFPAAGQTKPEKFLKLDFLPNRTRQITLGDDPQQKIGLLQVSVMWPVGKGILDAVEVAGTIINRFKNQVLFASGVKITISSEPWAASPIQDVDRLNIPVTVPYIAFEPET